MMKDSTHRTRKLRRALAFLKFYNGHYATRPQKVDVDDIYEWMTLGKIGETTIKEAWNSISENKYRDLHKCGKAHEIPACDRCPLRDNEIYKLKQV